PCPSPRFYSTTLLRVGGSCATPYSPSASSPGSSRSRMRRPIGGPELPRDLAGERARLAVERRERGLVPRHDLATLELHARRHQAALDREVLGEDRERLRPLVAAEGLGVPAQLVLDQLLHGRVRGEVVFE